jgi:hypothetical protein
MNEYSLFFDIFLRVFGAIMLYNGLKDLVTEIVWPWLRDKWQSWRKVAA